MKLGRPQFLVGGLVFYALGAALAAIDGASFDWHRYAWGQLFVSTTQLMTHYSNDYFDLEADRANSTPTRWSGGSRVLPSGAIRPGAALAAAIVLGVCALVTTLALAARVQRAPLVEPLALLMVALSWSYSAPPLRLLARGLGELTTALVVTLLTPLLGFYLQRGAMSPLPFLASAPLCGLQFAMLLTIELPDAVGDAAANKRTLVVLWGAEHAARLCAIITSASFCALPVLVFFGLPWPIAMAAALTAPLGVWQSLRLVRGAFREPGRWESLAFCSVALLFTTALAQLAGALGVLMLAAR
ncbi:MAG TPA: prenyltransferase [Polyangiaceae bacterium]|nr:prenyltransferase [Polyangiaceae bacterium]